MGTVAREIKPDIRLIGVEAELFPSMYNLLKGTNLPVGGDTLAEGIAVFEPGGFTSKVLAGLLDDLLLVSEADIERALAMLVQIEKTVVEGAGAAGLAAVLAHRDAFAGRRVGIVLSGGNIDTRLLANVLLRDLARSGRLARLRLVLQDRPGSLYRVSKIFFEHNVNIVEIVHQRVFTHLPAKGLATEIECESRDAEQLEALIGALRGEGFEVSLVELN
jgi:threonine dehydratase